MDSTRGATKFLVSANNDAEGTDAQGITSFDSDGFSLGTEYRIIKVVELMYLGTG